MTQPQFPHFQERAEFNGPQYAADPHLQQYADFPHFKGKKSAVVDVVPTRVYPWVFLVVQLIFTAWTFVAWVRSFSYAADKCSGVSSFGGVNELCIAAVSAGSTIGIALVIGLWVAADVILGTAYLVFKEKW